MSTLTTIQSTDLITNSRANLNDNFAALNADKLETSVLDSDTTLAANSDSKVATQKAVKAYIDGNGNTDIVAAQQGGGAFGTPSALNKFVTEEYLSSIVYGGDGSDGILNVASGTTTIDLTTKEIWQYESITIASGATLTFTGGTAGDKLPVLKCKGNFTNEGTITTVGLAGVAAVGGLKASVDTGIGTAGSGEHGDEVTIRFVDGTLPGSGRLGTGASRAVALGSGTGGVGGAAAPKNSTYFFPYSINGTCGGSGGGGISGNVGTPGDGGAGGAGSLGLVLEVVGNFNNTGTINLNGQAGTAGQNSPGNGSNSWSSGAGGGGGGGAAGSLVVKYSGSLTSLGTITTAGGAAGSGGNKTNTGASGGGPVQGGGGGGGSGGANSFNAGGAGSNGATGGEAGGSGGAGAAGIIYIARVG